jgi:hypothetical protein
LFKDSKVTARLKALQKEIDEFGGVTFQRQPFDTKGGIQNREIELLNENQDFVIHKIVKRPKWTLLT